MFNALPPVYKGILLALLGYTAFSCSDTCVKFLSHHYSIYEILVLENAVGAWLLLTLAPFLGGRKGLFRRDNLGIHSLRVVLNFVSAVLVVYSFNKLPMTTAYTLFFTIPFFSALWVIPLYKEYITKTRLLAILIGFTGVLIATRPGGESFHLVIIAPLSAACLIALLFCSGKSLHQPTMFMLAFPPMLGTCLLALPLAFMHATLPAPAHLGIFALAGVFSAGGFVAISVAFRIAAAAAVSPFMYIQMLWGIIFGYMIFGDLPDLWMLAGALVIIASGIYLVYAERQKI